MPRQMILLALKAGRVDWIIHRWGQQRRIFRLATLLFLVCLLVLFSFDWGLTLLAVHLAPSLVYTSNVGEIFAMKG